MTPLRIALVVQGRFHMFDLARELSRAGHDVRLFTNYPRRVAARFGVPPDRVETFPVHGLAVRAAGRLFPRGLGGRVERWGNTAFGRWAARRLAGRPWDAVVSMSGVAREAFEALHSQPAVKVLHRMSSHIRVQRRVLDEEAARAGVKWIDRPSDWIIDREEDEYRLADVIQVPPGFGEASFHESGVPADKVRPIRVGVDTQAFRAPAEIIEERCRRIVAGEPLRVLNVGTFCLRKGAVDFADLVSRAAASGRVRFRFVGPISPDARAVRDRIGSAAEFVGKRPQGELPAEYAWGDLFLLPTVEDGSPYVFVQARAAGLPVVTTPHCNGPDFIRPGENGWLVPIRDGAAVWALLERLDRDRPALVRAVRAVAAEPPEALDWGRTAGELVDLLTDHLGARAW